MPIEVLGEAAGMAVEFVAEAALDVAPDPPRRSRFWRFVYWTIMALLVGFLGVVVYFALS